MTARGFCMETETRMITEPDLITFPTHKIYPDLDIGELEEEIYYDDEIIEYEPEIYFLADTGNVASMDQKQNQIGH